MTTIDLIIGPMFGGKSTELIRRCKRLNSIGFKVLFVNNILDNRHGTSEITTHDGVHMKCLSTSDLSNVYDNIDEYDVVAIDEAQFFNDVATHAQTMCDTHGKRVIIASLSGDFQQKPWAGMAEMIAIADEITHCRALCVKCGYNASFTQKHVPNDERVHIGGADEYSPVCRTCYNLKG